MYSSKGTFKPLQFNHLTKTEQEEGQKRNREVLRRIAKKYNFKSLKVKELSPADKDALAMKLIEKQLANNKE